ncbi:unnamed protein product [Dovyalis caffra]|uniref:Exostosin GT47 domain-containing protein n=1 Tax=Dovyalis caffra TaxID=77055 RepID=A0AAV1SQE2_9ROSI|nr:unnamed protein product [Dovyalis caffra]
MSRGDSIEVRLSEESFDFQQNDDESLKTTCLQVLKGLSFQGAIIAAVILSPMLFFTQKKYAELKGDFKNEVGDIYRSKSIFFRNYAAMERDFKIFVYPDGNATTCYHSTDHKLESKYASEHYFFKNLIDSRFLTDDPREAHFFFIPISCGKMGSTAWITFFVSCHDIGSRAAAEVPFLLKNAIRLVCSPSYDSNYIRQKDIALPQILELSLPPTTDSSPFHGSDICNR